MSGTVLNCGVIMVSLNRRDPCLPGVCGISKGNQGRGITLKNVYLQIKESALKERNIILQVIVTKVSTWARDLAQ